MAVFDHCQYIILSISTALHPYSRKRLPGGLQFFDVLTFFALVFFLGVHAFAHFRTDGCPCVDLPHSYFLRFPQLNAGHPLKDFLTGRIHAVVTDAALNFSQVTILYIAHHVRRSCGVMSMLVENGDGDFFDGCVFIRSIQKITALLHQVIFDDLHQFGFQVPHGHQCLTMLPGGFMVA